MTAAELMHELQRFQAEAVVFIYDDATREAVEINAVNWDMDGDVMLSVTGALSASGPERAPTEDERRAADEALTALRNRLAARGTASGPTP
jgi:hypothetical protein